jgi:uncharacterized protein
MFKENLMHKLKVLPVILPMLFFGVLISSALTILIPTRAVASLFGNNAGFLGIIIGIVFGILLPNEPFMALPVIGSIWRQGAETYAIVAILTSWSLFSIGRYPIEIGLIGPKLTIKRSLYAVWIPFATGSIVYLAGKAINIL